ncbi:uncharacterized protein LOC133792434 [Humulus lupulus]|uniref:uncharacterized protein LOC133792434 n=1 Tax=Humulus lupulus TaxID=3486 RepID=UPI002B409D6F|nr:uncharacterized protein LOC133792434 [Humulus lupulus]
MKFIDPDSLPSLQYLTKAYQSSSTLNPAFIDWEQQDQLLYTWLHSSMTKTILTRIQLKNFKKGSLTIHDYLLRLKTKLGSVGHPVTSKEHIVAIFKGLPPDYDLFIISVNSRSQPYTVAEIESLLLAQESQLEKHQNELDSSVVVANLTYSSGFKKRGALSSNNRSTTASLFVRPSWNPYATCVRPRFNSSQTIMHGPSSAISSFSAQSSGQPSGCPTCQLCLRPGHVASKCYQCFNQEFPGYGASPLDKSASQHIALISLDAM